MGKNSLSPGCQAKNLTCRSGSWTTINSINSGRSGTLYIRPMVSGHTARLGPTDRILDWPSPGTTLFP
ncbi:hypothetical protein IF2G_05801 [Cordyceps javanica]|nr:hypothetical protein IF2G_05801 [Cordyceps javanica]